MAVGRSCWKHVVLVAAAALLLPYDSYWTHVEYGEESIAGKTAKQNQQQP